MPSSFVPACAASRSCQMRQWQGRAGFESLDRDVAADLAHDRQLQKLADEKALIILEVGHDDLEEIIGLARDEVAGDDFRHLDHRLLEARRLFVGVTVDLHTQEYREAEADAAALQGCAIAVDDAVALEALDAPQARRRRQPYSLGEFDIAQPGIGLQFADDPAVDGIKAAFWHKSNSSDRTCAHNCVLDVPHSTLRRDLLRSFVGWSCRKKPCRQKE